MPGLSASAAPRLPSGCWSCSSKAPCEWTFTSTFEFTEVAKSLHQYVQAAVGNHCIHANATTPNRETNQYMVCGAAAFGEINVCVAGS